MSYRLRLTLFGVGVVAVAMVTFAAALLGLARQAAPTNQAELVSQRAAVAAAAVGSDRSAAVILDPTASGVSVALLDDTGRPRSVGGLALLPGVLARASETGGAGAVTLDSAGTEVRYHVVPVADGFVVAWQPTAATLEELAGLRAVVWIAVILTLVAAWVVSWIVAGRALRPLRLLAETTDEIGSTGALDRRLPTARRHDEVGRLTTSFNAMLDRLSAAQAKLAEALDQQRRFVADASHELRTPLTSIRANAGFLQSRPDAAEGDRMSAVGDIAAQSHRMASLVEDLLALAALDALPPPPPTTVDLTGIVAGAARSQQRMGEKIELDVAPGVEVVGDGAALERLVRILVDNAVKHGEPPFEVRLAGTDAGAVLTVADRGPGFPPDELERVFDRFHRADPARTSEGAGLGLSIAQRTAERHGGTIRAVNRPDGGATIVVTIPQAG